MRYKNNALL